MRHRVSISTRLHFAFALCCHSNETQAPTANPPNSAQLGAPPIIPPTYIWVRAVMWECSEGQTYRQTRVTNIHLASSTTHTKCRPNDHLILLLLVSRLTHPNNGVYRSQTSADNGSCFKSSTRYDAEVVAATEQDELVDSDEPRAVVLGRRRRLGARDLVDRVINILTRGRDLPSTTT